MWNLDERPSIRGYGHRSHNRLLRTVPLSGAPSIITTVTCGGTRNLVLQATSSLYGSQSWGEHLVKVSWSNFLRRLSTSVENDAPYAPTRQRTIRAILVTRVFRAYAPSATYAPHAPSAPYPKIYGPTRRPRHTRLTRLPLYIEIVTRHTHHTHHMRHTPHTPHTRHSRHTRFWKIIVVKPWVVFQRNRKYHKNCFCNIAYNFALNEWDGKKCKSMRRWSVLLGLSPELSVGFGLVAWVCVCVCVCVCVSLFLCLLCRENVCRGGLAPIFTPVQIKPKGRH